MILAAAFPFPLDALLVLGREPGDLQEEGCCRGADPPPRPPQSLPSVSASRPVWWLTLLWEQETLQC